VISRVTVPMVVFDELLGHGTEAAPGECCGVLLGRTGEIAEAVRTPNIAADPLRRFEIDPKAHFAAIRRSRALGVDIIGAYHSHPHGAAVPSETDKAEAFEDEAFVHLIIAPHKEEIAAYFLIAGNFVAVPLVRIR
jgi:proteasome lid subunit RPN8/RPN11